MRRMLQWTLIVTGVVLIAGCADESNPVEPADGSLLGMGGGNCLSTDQQALSDAIRADIEVLFSDQTGVIPAMQQLNNIERKLCKEQYEDALAMAWDFLGLIDDKMPNGFTGDAADAAALASEVFALVAADPNPNDPAVEIPPGAFDETGGITTFDPSTATPEDPIIAGTGNGEAAVVVDAPDVFPPGTGPVTIVLTRQAAGVVTAPGAFIPGFQAFEEGYEILSSAQPWDQGPGALIALCVVPPIPEDVDLVIGHLHGEDVSLLVPTVPDPQTLGYINCSDVETYPGGGVDVIGQAGDDAVGQDAGWSELLRRALEPVGQWLSPRPLDAAALGLAGPGLGGRTRSFSLDAPVDPTIEVGETIQLSVGTDATWSSDDANVATVDSDGLVTGVGAGMATITADFTDYAGNPASLSMTITVEGVSPGGAVPVLFHAYRFDYSDVSGFGNHGTPLGDPGFTAGSIDVAVDLDGVGDLVRVSAAPSLEPATVSVEICFSPNSTLGAGHPFVPLLVKLDPNDNFSGIVDGYDLSYQDQTARGGTTVLIFGVGDDAGNTRVQASSQATLAGGAYHHVVGTYDLNELRLYLNGTLVASTAHANPIAYLGGPVSVGGGIQNLLQVPSGDLSYLDGRVEETFVYDGVLTAAQVATGAARCGVPAPGGQQVAFESRRDGGDYEIYVMNTDGSGQQNLTNSPGTDAGPAWSPDGSRIAFQSHRDGAGDIWVMNADGSSPVNLTQDASAFQLHPTWSPDGSRIAFMNRTPYDQIWVIDADGSNLTFIAGTSAANAGFPAWSPDGTQIAFSTERDGNSEIYVMDADGSNPVNLTNDAGFDLTPVWSPDGTQIMWYSTRSGNGEVWVMDADGSNPTNLTNDPSNDRRGTWSPDGQSIAFDSDRSGNSEIYVMNADGTGVTRLTVEPAEDSGAAWQP